MPVGGLIIHRLRRKATFLAKSPQIMLRKMSASTFDAINRTESGAWSAAVVSLYLLHD